MKRSNRRDFLKQSAAAGVGFWVAGDALADRRTATTNRSPNGRINIACIGVGGKGDSDTDQAGNHGTIVALCDIDDRYLESKAHRFPKARKYHDFRKMLEEMGKEIDAVTVSTPDHTHAAASIMAMKMKKHVYCQKPLTHTVAEARLMRETAAKYGVATQMGNQGTTENGLRRAVEIIQAGAIGPVHEAHVWTNRPIWPQAPIITARPPESSPPPYVHWDLWLGPAPERPYALLPKDVSHDQRPAYHPFNWRGWWDFGTGALGDMACHTANMAFMALRLGYPTSVVAESGPINHETYPAWARITFEFPARGELPPVKLTWYEGRRDGHKVLPPQDLTKGLRVPDSGSLLVGSKGMLYSPNDYGAQYRLLPEKEFEGYQGPPQTLARNGRGDDGHKAEWIAACKGGPPALSNFNYAGMLTEAILLGNVAMRVGGKKLEWDGPSMRFTNASEANQYLQTEYRNGWTL
jgi:predicted dehydrogenase